MASLMHYSPRWRCMVDELGPSLFVLLGKDEINLETLGSLSPAGQQCFGLDAFVDIMQEYYFQNKLDFSFEFPASELTSRLEGLVGDYFPEKLPLFYWGDISGPAAVEVKGGLFEGNYTHVDIDLDLAARVAAIDDPEVDIDFNVKLACDDDHKNVFVHPYGFKVKLHWFYTLFGPMFSDDVAHGYDIQIAPQTILFGCPFDEISYTAGGDILLKINDVDMDGK